LPVHNSFFPFSFQQKFPPFLWLLFSAPFTPSAQFPSTMTIGGRSSHQQSPSGRVVASACCLLFPSLLFAQTSLALGWIGLSWMEYAAHGFWIIPPPSLPQSKCTRQMLSVSIQPTPKVIKKSWQSVVHMQIITINSTGIRDYSSPNIVMH
jgi:hypothetical protein